MSNVSVTWRPLTAWPTSRPLTPDWKREQANFKTPSRYEDTAVGVRNTGRKRIPLSQTLDDLDRELWAIGARKVVIQVDITDRQLRNDGGIRADASASSPPVVLNFTRNDVPYVFACDHFTHWHDNLRAIALGLEGLRRLERYHIAQAGDQYRGWQALPASTTTAFNVEQAAALLERIGDNGFARYASAAILADAMVARQAYRRAAARTHPDVGGSTNDFKLVQEAKRVLEAHFGATL